MIEKQDICQWVYLIERKLVHKGVKNNNFLILFHRTAIKNNNFLILTGSKVDKLEILSKIG